MLQFVMNWWESQAYTYCPGLLSAAVHGRWWEFALLKRSGSEKVLSCPGDGNSGMNLSN